MFAHLAFTMYHSLRLVGNKMEPRDFKEFVPKWESKPPDGEEVQAVDSDGLKAKINKFFTSIRG